MIKNIYILGVGLIGGSMALDLKKAMPATEIYGVDYNEKHLAKALHLGIIDKKARLDDIKNADVVIVSVPVDVLLHILPDVLDLVSDSCVVIDVGSTKGAICSQIEKHPKRRNFLAMHPIAGTEHSGPLAAVENLFLGKTNIVCEIEKTALSLQEKAMEIVTALGMRVRYMDAHSHDKHIAYVSHLSHISSFMLGKTVIEKEENERDIFDLAGSGFESTVRLAKSSPAMWTPIFEQNSAHVVDALDGYIENLVRFRENLKNKNYKAIRVDMADTNRIKEILNGIKSTDGK